MTRKNKSIKDLKAELAALDQRIEDSTKKLAKLRQIRQNNVYDIKEPKTLAYDYLFNYFGKKTFKGKIILGASIQLGIRVYKNKQEVKFSEEPKYQNNYLSDVYEVSFEREKMFRIEKNLGVENLLRIVFGWDNIQSEVVGYTLDCKRQIRTCSEIFGVLL